MCTVGNETHNNEIGVCHRNVVFYGFETWSLTLTEERRLRVFENKVLRRIFGPKRAEVTGAWRKLLNEELLICTPHPKFCG